MKQLHEQTILFAEGLDHPEGVAVHRDGSVWAGGEGGQVYRVAPGGGHDMTATDEQADPTAWWRPGRVLLALVAFLEEHPRAATAIGKLVRWDAAAAAPSVTLDSTGIVVRRSRGSFDRGEGRPDGKHFDHTEEVFGGSGAALLARRAGR